MTRTPSFQSGATYTKPKDTQANTSADSDRAWRAITDRCRQRQVDAYPRCSPLWIASSQAERFLTSASGMRHLCWRFFSTKVINNWGFSIQRFTGCSSDVEGPYMVCTVLINPSQPIMALLLAKLNRTLAGPSKKRGGWFQDFSAPSCGSVKILGYFSQIHA